MSESDISVCHITSVHQRYDVRIFHKECRSLALHYRVFLVVADGLGDEELGNVSIVDAGKREGSLAFRFIRTNYKVYKTALRLNCRIYHFHDPEFMWFGYMLLRRNRKVIYDVHEDLPRQIKWKQHIKAFLRPVISFCAEIAEKILSRKFSAIVAATPHIGDRFRRYNSLVEVVCNYVIQEEFSPVNSFTERPSNLCYIGGLTEPRGLRELINAMEDINPGIRLNLAGKFEHKEFENEIKQTKGWQRVIFFGYADRKKIREILDNSVIGLLTLHPSPGYLDSLPVKLFEYMASGIPVIASDFPLWKSIIIDNNCGLCLNPLKPKEISNAIMQLVNDRSMAESMGLNGLAAVQREFNWETQKNKLFQLYKNL